MNATMSEYQVRNAGTNNLCATCPDYATAKLVAQELAGSLHRTFVVYQDGVAGYVYRVGPAPQC